MTGSLMVIFLVLILHCYVALANQPDLQNLYNSDGTFAIGTITNIPTPLPQPDWQTKTENLQWNFGNPNQWVRSTNGSVRFPLVSGQSLLASYIDPPLGTPSDTLSTMGNCNEAGTQVDTQFQFVIAPRDPLQDSSLRFDVVRSKMEAELFSLWVVKNSTGIFISTIFADVVIDQLPIAQTFPLDVTVAIQLTEFRSRAYTLWVNNQVIRRRHFGSNADFGCATWLLYTNQANNFDLLNIKAFSPTDGTVFDAYVDLTCPDSAVKSSSDPVIYDCRNYPPAILTSPSAPPIFSQTTLQFTPEILLLNLKMSDLVSHPQLSDLTINLSCPQNTDSIYQITLDDGTNACGLTIDPSATISISWSEFQMASGQLNFSAFFKDSVMSTGIVNIYSVDSFEINITSGVFEEIPLAWFYQLLNPSQKTSQFKVVSITLQNQNYQTEFQKTPPVLNELFDGSWWASSALKLTAFPIDSDGTLDTIGGILQQIVINFEIHTASLQPYNGVLNIKIQPIMNLGKDLYISSSTSVSPLLFSANNNATGTVGSDTSIFETSQLKPIPFAPLVESVSLSSGSLEPSGFKSFSVSFDAHQPANLTYYLYDTLLSKNRTLSDPASVLIYPLLEISPGVSPSPTDDLAPMKVVLILTGYLDPSSRFRFEAEKAGYFDPTQSHANSFRWLQTQKPGSVSDLTMIDPKTKYNSDQTIDILNNMYLVQNLLTFSFNLFETKSDGSERILASVLVRNSQKWEIGLGSTITIIIATVCSVLGVIALLVCICCIRTVIIKRQEIKPNKLKLEQLKYLSQIVDTIEIKSQDSGGQPQNHEQRHISHSVSESQNKAAETSISQSKSKKGRKSTKTTRKTP